MPEISVIIPVYNVEDYLGACLDSVLNQTFSDFELICIDDCSTDNSFSVLKEYEKKDPRIRVLQNEKNLRAADTRNAGLDRARGKYIYFIDADDSIENGYLEELHDTAERTGADIVMNTNIHTHTNGREAKYVHPIMPPIPEEGTFIDSVTSIEKAFCVVWMRLFRRQFLEDHGIRFRRVNMTEDNVFHYMTSVNASSIFAFNGRYAYHYLLRGDSVTGIVKSNNLFDYQTMKANDLIFDYLSGNNLLEKNKARIFNVLTFFKVDTEEKFDLYKSYFLKIRDFLEAHKKDYNEMDLFFADAVLSSENLQDYLSRYPANVAIAYIKNRNKKR